MSYDLLLAGTSVKTHAYIESYDGVFQGPPVRGSDLVLPVKRGQSFAAKPFDAYTFSVPLALLGTSQGDVQDKIDALRKLTASAGSITVSRTKPSAAGDVTTTCTGTAMLTEVAMLTGLVNGRAILEVTNLDGCWYGTAVAPTIPATLTVAGTARTNRMTLVLPGTGTLSNTTLGVSVAVTAGQTLTVETKQTTGTLSTITPAGDPFGNWFTLAPGSNVITWSGGGTPTISYQPAYL